MIGDRWAVGVEHRNWVVPWGDTLSMDCRAGNRVEECRVGSWVDGMWGMQLEA